MSVKGGNLGARVWSSQLLIDNQAARTGIPTRPAHLPARGQVPCTYLPCEARRSLTRWMTLADQARGDERGTCDIRQFAATAGEPARPGLRILTSRTETVRGTGGTAPTDLPPSRGFSSRTHWAFTDSDTLNHVGGPANSFQAICLVVTWALCSGRPHHLLRLACCRKIPCPVPPSRYHHGSMGMAG